MTIFAKRGGGQKMKGWKEGGQRTKEGERVLRLFIYFLFLVLVKIFAKSSGKIQAKISTTEQQHSHHRKSRYNIYFD